jgi:acyl-coenzyme A thioesterase PaaI-like protein
MLTKLAELEQVRDGTRPPPPIAALLGFTLSAVAAGEAVIEFTAGRQHANPMGTLHGPWGSPTRASSRRARPSRPSS